MAKRDAQAKKAMLDELRKAEEEVERKVKDLQASKAFIESMFNAIADPIMVAGKDLNYVAVNKAATELLGYREDELIGHPTTKVLVPRERHLAGKMTAKEVATGKTFKYERTWLTKNGVEIPVVLHGAPLRDAKGEIVGAIAVARDMREIKSLVTELEQRKAFIESMFSALADAVIVTDREGTIVTVNKAATELLGYQEDELIGQHTRMLLVPRQRHLAGTALKEVIAKGTAVQYERIWQTKDGVEIPVLVHSSPLRDSQGVIIGGIGVVRDIREIKSLITELERGKAFVENLFSALADAVIVTDRESTIVTVNRAATELLGYQEDELIGQHTRMLRVPRQRHLETAAKEVFAKGTAVQYERIWQTKDGVEIPVLVHSAPLRDSQGVIIGVIGVIRDIREIKSFITKLAHSEERYRALFEYAPGPIGVVDRSNIVQLWNQQAEKHMGYTAEEIIGRSTRMLVPDELYEEGKWLMREVREKGYVKEYETERIHKNGVRLPVEVTIAALTDEQGNFIGAEFMVRDISERKRLERERAEAQEALTHSEERYRALFEHAPDPIIVTDANNVVRLCNKRAEEHSGYKAEEIIGKSAKILVPSELHEQAKWLAQEVKKKGYVQSYESERMIKGGVRIPVELTVASLEDDLGNFIGFTTVVRDISERKRMERERAEAQERMIRAERLAAIGELAASVAHELRQPLSVINNCVYLLKMKSEAADEKVTKHLGILEKEVATSEKIISDLLDFAKPKRLALEQAELNSIIEQALSRAQLPQEVEVMAELKELPPLMADEEQLERVFLNVILNAAQAMPDGGKLVVSTEKEDSLIKAEVRDSGSGIPEEDLGKVFEPLFSKKARGIGLGLSIARSIIEAHQGTIEIKSQFGRGTTVTIKLPIGGKGD